MKRVKLQKKSVKQIFTRNRIKLISFWSILTFISTILAVIVVLYIFPKLPFGHGPIAKAQAYALSAKKIADKSFSRNDTKIQANSANEIITEIVKRRTENNYLYTGGHYTDFYIRNLGTFANKLVERQSASSNIEWLSRLELLTRSTEVALSVFSSYGEITTTIVQLENGKYVPINIYVKPSDSLPSLLRIIYQLKNIDQNSSNLNLSPTEQMQLNKIVSKTNTMLETYKPFLESQSNIYIESFSDSNNGLIKSDITLSGIKDSWIRRSSLYDNVMLWSVYNYSAKLNIQEDWDQKAILVKNKIIKERWSHDSGIFFDEIPEKSCNPYKTKKCLPYFSADNLITFEMGMLDPYNPQDKLYLSSIIDYISQNSLDKPFPLKATEIRLPQKEHLPVKLLAPNYTGTTIWSYWGMVYIDLVDTLSNIDNDQTKKELAKKHLQSYTDNIIRYQGFPELYTPQGKKYELPFYRSVNDMVWGIYYLYLENKIN
jgi:hypothetical protein